MTRTSTFAALILLASASAAFAQNNSSAPSPGTNSAGTAQSSGTAPNREPGVTTGSGLGSGRAVTEPMPSTDKALNDENKTIDSKLKGICRGC